jgi:uncharacterized protein (DUF427 family)
MKINHVYYFPKQDVIFYVMCITDNFACCDWLIENGNVWYAWKDKSFFKRCIDLGEL